jgi:oligopeptide transport system permease protein
VSAPPAHDLPAQAGSGYAAAAIPAARGATSGAAASARRRAEEPPGTLGQAARRFFRNRPAAAGLAVAALFVLAALFAPVIAPTRYDFATLADALTFPGGPGSKYPLGTDAVGRDFLSRLVYGARTSMTVGFTVPAIALLIGLPLGAAAGWFGGKADAVITRLIEFWTAFPPILFAVFLVTLFGHDLAKVILYLGVTGWVGPCRLTRAQFLALREREFVTAARAVGTPEWEIMARHVLVNAAGPLIVMFTLGIPGAIFGEAGLSFLGLGVNDPLPSWGKMVADSGRYAAVYWYLAIFPTLCLALAMLSFSFVGDGLRDALDPYGQR